MLNTIEKISDGLFRDNKPMPQIYEIQLGESSRLHVGGESIDTETVVGILALEFESSEQMVSGYTVDGSFFKVKGESEIKKLPPYEVFLKRPRLYAELNHDKRAWPLDEIGAPKGWVVNGALPQECWEIIKANTLPIKPQKGISRSIIRAKKRIKEIENQYGEEIIVALIPDSTDWSGWSAKPVLIPDLFKSTEELVREKETAEANDEQLLSGMKRHSIMITNGLVDY